MLMGNQPNTPSDWSSSIFRVLLRDTLGTQLCDSFPVNSKKTNV